MLKLKPIEFFLRALPESFLFMVAIYVFSKTNMEKKKYLVSSFLYAVVIYITRLLPINYGVHTILGLMLLLLLTILYNKIDVIKAMRSTIMIFLIQFISESINLFIINFIPNISINELFENPLIKTIIGLPSLIIATIVVYLFSLLSINEEV